VLFVIIKYRLSIYCLNTIGRSKVSISHSMVFEELAKVKSL